MSDGRSARLQYWRQVAGAGTADERQRRVAAEWNSLLDLQPVLAWCEECEGPIRAKRRRFCSRKCWTRWRHERRRQQYEGYERPPITARVAGERIVPTYGRRARSA